jgi:hypothetical protein
MAGVREETTMIRMRRNVRKKVTLAYKHYELRVKAQVQAKGQDEFEAILPLIKIKYLKRQFIHDEIFFELLKIKDIINAALLIEVYSVYGTAGYIGEYKRYLGEMNFYVSGLDNYEQAIYRYKNSLAYFQQPDKSSFIPERV